MQVPPFSQGLEMQSSISGGEGGAQSEVSLPLAPSPQGNQAEDAVMTLPSTPDPRTSAVVCADDPVTLAAKGVEPHTTDIFASVRADATGPANGESMQNVLPDSTTVKVGLANRPIEHWS